MASVWSWVQAKIPAGVEVFDAHAHIGVGHGRPDDDRRRYARAHGGRRGQEEHRLSPERPERPRRLLGAERRRLERLRGVPILFVPFFRLNPHLDYDREFGRCVERGFMGLKLHPVSQKFELDDPRVVRLFGMAAEADLPVLIHTGFAMQRIVEPLLPTVEAHPGLRLILGHCGDGRGARGDAAPSRTTPTCCSRPPWCRPKTCTSSAAPSTLPDLLRVGHTLRRPALDAARHPRGGRGRWGA